MDRILNLVLIGVAVALGCGGQQPADSPKPKPKTVAKADAKEPAAKEHDHSDWWCDEHGVPEAECSVCQKEVFKKLKADEICPHHPDRAKAQCFICNPELREKFAA